MISINMALLYLLSSDVGFLHYPRHYPVSGNKYYLFHIHQNQRACVAQ